MTRLPRHRCFTRSPSYARSTLWGVALLALAVNCPGQDLQKDAPWLACGPVPGFTTAVHPTNREMFLPVDALVEFSVQGLAVKGGTTTPTVRWSGIQPLATTNLTVKFRVPAAALTITATTSAPRRTFTCNVIGIRVTPESLKFDYDLREAAPLGLTQRSSNAETVAAYFSHPSIARVTKHPYGQSTAYSTSVNRDLSLDLVGDTGITNLIEVRMDGRPIGVGSTQFRASRIGLHEISVGPPAHQRALRLAAYRAEIVAAQEGFPEGIPLLFAAKTTPPGFENEVRWLAATKYGTAGPVLGRGPFFRPTFRNTFHGGVGASRWVGVRASNASSGVDGAFDVPAPVWLVDSRQRVIWRRAPGATGAYTRLPWPAAATNLTGLGAAAHTLIALDSGTTPPTLYRLDPTTGAVRGSGRAPAGAYGVGASYNTLTKLVELFVSSRTGASSRLHTLNSVTFQQLSTCAQPGLANSEGLGAAGTSGGATQSYYVSRSPTQSNIVHVHKIRCTITIRMRFFGVITGLGVSERLIAASCTVDQLLGFVTIQGSSTVTVLNLLTNRVTGNFPLPPGVAARDLRGIAAGSVIPNGC